MPWRHKRNAVHSPGAVVIPGLILTGGRPVSNRPLQRNSLPVRAAAGRFETGPYRNWTDGGPVSNRPLQRNLPVPGAR
jgi:hypothetical protein